ncbi:MAG: CapA family protein [Clostridiales bacterium]|jgi:poly-gamma-glutamate synthesis protein (capsule biosynthesis protein)|nr:CapA family protein [Clostridiales bacterium]
MKKLLIVLFIAVSTLVGGILWAALPDGDDLTRGRRHIPWEFVTFSEPDFESDRLGRFAPQTVVYTEDNGDGWILISTHAGPAWLYYRDVPPPLVAAITISAAGDTTLGGDRRWAGYHAFMREFANSGQDHSHFLRNVVHIFEEDDLTILNLEGTLTYATAHMDKQFVFRGPPHFAQILSTSSVEVVSIANNHTIDFFDRGYRDTMASLRAVGVEYFGNYYNTIMEINGISVGLFGHRIWSDSAFNRNRIEGAIRDLQNRGAQLIIAYYHWGVERSNVPEPYQVAIGRFSIDRGAHLVLGAHPHVVQGIEEHDGRNIVYSLANFSFGGNSNPHDQDSFIFQQTFTFHDGVLQPENDTNIIPIFVSSVRYRNDFQPTVAQGADAERILGRIRAYTQMISH